MIKVKDHAVQVKVCGLRRAEDALLALELGADFIGLIFAPESPRHITPAEAKALLETVRAAAKTPVRPVGVFVSESPEQMCEIATELQLARVQIHGAVDPQRFQEFPCPLLRAIRVKGPQSAPEIEEALANGAVLLDAFVEGKAGGTGRTFDHELAIPFLDRGDVWIAGGLKPDNIAAIARGFLDRPEPKLPFAFDVSSGLESSPGVKDHDKVRLFFQRLTDALAHP